MRFKAIAAVDASTKLNSTMEVVVPPYTFSLRSNDKGYLDELAIHVPVDCAENPLPRFTTGAGSLDNPHHINIPENKHADDLVGLLQYVESMGGVYFGVRKIRWEEVKFEWVADTDDERRRLDLIGIGTPTITYPRSDQAFDPKAFVQMISQRAQNEDLVVPMSFVREALADFEHHRYINAYCNFYFCLEYQFGEGRTKNRDVETAFGRAKLLVAAIKTTISEYQKSQPDLAVLSRFLAEHRWTLDEQGLIRTMVWVRGSLHHSSKTKRLFVANPLNQGRFRAFAYLVMQVCIWAFMHRMIGQATRTPPPSRQDPPVCKRRDGP